jgi:chitinase
LGFSQIPNPALIGYFQNWNSVNAPYVALNQIDSRYNVIVIAFALPKSGTDYDMEFTPQQVTSQQFISQVQALKNQGKKVILSLGGGTAVVKLDNATEKNTFVSSVTSLINTYGFDGIDIDFEGTSVRVTSGTTISNPTDASLINLIDALKSIMATYRANYDEKMILTMAPETAYVQGGQSSYGNTRGAYLPILDALRDSIDILQVQLYNSGNMYGIDGSIYTQGTPDFIVAMVEAVIQGFITQGGYFNGFPANKVAVGLPACSSAAGGGFTSTTDVKDAIDYLLGIGSQPGLYSLQNSGGYANLLGMMTWSLNWDKISTCGGSYEYAQNFQDIFGNVQASIGEGELAALKVYPNPANNILNIDFNEISKSVDLEMISIGGKVIKRIDNISNTKVQLSISDIDNGVYFLKVVSGLETKLVKVVKV